MWETIVANPYITVALGALAFFVLGGMIWDTRRIVEAL
jgi:hypothetical protein